MDLYSFPQKNGEEGPDFEVGGEGYPLAPLQLHVYRYVCIRTRHNVDVGTTSFLAPTNPCVMNIQSQAHRVLTITSFSPSPYGK
jgi:hypothetical protein